MYHITYPSWTDKGCPPTASFPGVAADSQSEGRASQPASWRCPNRPSSSVLIPSSWRRPSLRRRDAGASLAAQKAVLPRDGARPRLGGREKQSAGGRKNDGRAPGRAAMCRAPACCLVSEGGDMTGRVWVVWCAGCRGWDSGARTVESDRVVGAWPGLAPGDGSTAPRVGPRCGGRSAADSLSGFCPVGAFATDNSPTWRTRPEPVPGLWSLVAACRPPRWAGHLITPLGKSLFFFWLPAYSLHSSKVSFLTCK